uniref:Uncharacterized protein n=1 Tax=Lactuca sativa TaxID=4236 RepID=A0A9R1WQJ9_LACSA|nr:hypothetical protein LSAT_V11C900462260 [Lactuca sativa]
MGKSKSNTKTKTMTKTKTKTKTGQNHDGLLLALSNKNKFMESRPPMLIWIDVFRDDWCYFDDSSDRTKMIKIRLPHSSGKTLVGLTRGYLILFGRIPRHFWLVNPITRHGPSFPFFFSFYRWVFVVGKSYITQIWFSIAGKSKVAWNHLIFDQEFIDLHVFKGKIYAINCSYEVYELRLNPITPEEKLLKTKNDSCNLLG